MKPRPRRDYKEGQHRQNVEIKRLKVKDLIQDESLWIDAHDIASKEYPQSELALDLEMCELHDICPFCRTQLEMYTTKKDWKYLANPDRSPHRKSYECSFSWEQYNSIPPVTTKDV